MFLIQDGQERPLRSQLIDSRVWFTAHTVWSICWCIWMYFLIANVNVTWSVVCHEELWSKNRRSINSDYSPEASARPKWLDSGPFDAAQIDLFLLCLFLLVCLTWGWTSLSTSHWLTGRWCRNRCFPPTLPTLCPLSRHLHGNRPVV